MNLENFVQACHSRRPVAIVLQNRDYHQLVDAFPDTGVMPDWNKREMLYRGAPIARGVFFNSYIIEDTPDGPLIHMVD